MAKRNYYPLATVANIKQCLPLTQSCIGVLEVPSQESERSCICMLEVPSQESERSCICVLEVSSQESEVMYLCIRGIKPGKWAVMYLCARGIKPGKWAVMYLCAEGIDFAFFYNFSIVFWNCSDSMAFLCSLFYYMKKNNRQGNCQI